jgi:twitching motility protein PilT
LREDADIVLVGEMRDLETISLALTAAETGLLVFGTLHTNNARKTVDRIIDVFPSDQQSQVRTMLSASLRGVVAQLLMKRSDISGRVAVNEVLVSTPAVGAIIREGATQKLYDVITGGKQYGMQFMDEAIWDKLRAGMVSPLEAYMKAIDKARFKSFLPKEHELLAAQSEGGRAGAGAGGGTGGQRQPPGAAA